MSQPTKDPAAVALGSKGGRAKSEAKTRTAQENGTKPPKPGSKPRGRPSKSPDATK